MHHEVGKVLRARLVETGGKSRVAIVETNHAVPGIDQHLAKPDRPGSELLAQAHDQHQRIAIFGAQVVLGLSQGVGYPLLMGLSIRYVVQDNRTTAMGLHQAVYSVGMFGGPWLSGILADAMGIQPMFGVTALGCLVLGVGGASMLRRKSEE